MLQLKRKLLVFDDDPGSGNLIRKVAVSNKFQAKSVTDQTQFAAIDRTDVDALVIDVDVLSRLGVDYLLQQDKHSRPKAVILIGKWPDSQLQQFAASAIAKGLPITGILAKPLTTEALTRHFQDKLLSLPVASTAATQQVSWEELRQAIHTEALTAYFQPKVDPRSGELAGVEALARWTHPSKGLIMPGLFIPLAEETGLITPLFRAVASQVFAQCARWQQTGLHPKVALNLSVANLSESDLPATLAGLAAQHNIELSQIILEITESGLLQDTTAALNVLTRLAQHGAELSIDDFGSGYASIQQLQRISFNELKIDRFFVHEAVKSNDSLVILESLFTMARKLGLKIVAEGLETRQHWDLLAQLGCDQVQGYLIGKPMPGAALLDWFEQWPAQYRLLINRPKYTSQLPAATSPPKPKSPVLLGWFLVGNFDDSDTVQRLPINQVPFRIGRQKDLNLCIDKLEISRAHAEIYRRGDHLVIRDLGSTNGTFVNHERVTAEADLNAGDYLCFAENAQYRLIHDLTNEDQPIEKKTSVLFPSQR